MPYRNILIIEYLSMFVVWLTVVIVYWASTKGAWARSPEGRLMMADAVLFVWFGALVLAGIFLHEWPGRIPISIGSVGLITVTGLWRLRIIVRAQQLKRKMIEQRQREERLSVARGRHESDRRR